MTATKRRDGRTKPRASRAVFYNQKGAIVYDPMCSLPYSMNGDEAKEYLAEGKFAIGVRVVFPDHQVTVGAVLEMEV